MSVAHGPGNRSNSCCTDRSFPLHTANSVSIGLILVRGLLLNSLALWVFCCRLCLWTETRVYMVNLVAADGLLLSLQGSCTR